MKKILVVLITLISLIGCDRVTKIQAITHLKGNDPLSYLGGLFQLTYHENSGAMLSLGANLPVEIRFYLFTLAVGAALLGGIIYIVVKPLPRLHFILALLIIGGGLGNLYDRAFNNGQVVDFMLIDLGLIRTGVFNVADMAIMVGAICFAILSFKSDTQPTNRPKTTPENGAP